MIDKTSMENFICKKCYGFGELIQKNNKVPCEICNQTGLIPLKTCVPI